MIRYVTKAKCRCVLELQEVCLEVDAQQELHSKEVNEDNKRL